MYEGKMSLLKLSTIHKNPDKKCRTATHMAAVYKFWGGRGKNLYGRGQSILGSIRQTRQIR